MFRYLNGVVHGAILCVVGLGVWIYKSSLWDKICIQWWILTNDWLEDLTELLNIFN